MRKFFAFLCGVVFLFATLASAQGGVIPSLQQLFDGEIEEVIVSDKRFFNWRLYTYPETTESIDYSQILVDELFDPLDPLNPGLRFLANDQLTASGENSLIDIYFQFDVESTGALIKDISLELNDFAFPADSGLDARIRIKSGTGDQVSISVDQDNYTNGPFYSEADFLAPAAFIYDVTTPIQIIGDPNGDVGINEFDLRFSQVPEPATMLLLGTGLVGLVALRRKFRK